MKLTEILNKLSVIQVAGEPETAEIERIAHDSREVEVNTLFVAVKGFQTDGHKFLQEVLSKNAAAVVVEDDSALPENYVTNFNAVKILVKDSRRALAEISNIFFDEPSKMLKLIGITGTKGKTTSTYFLKSIFDVAGIKSGLIGTNKNMIGKDNIYTRFTTPEANKINALLDQMVKGDCTHCVMEVSSHGLALDRTYGLEFDTGVFTNLTSDHLDFHKDFEHYLASKQLLFSDLNSSAYAIYNADDTYSKRLLENCIAMKISYGSTKDCDFHLTEISYGFDGTTFTFRYDNNEYKVKTTLIGAFNAYNAVSAIAAAIMNGLDVNKAIEGIERTEQVPGRFEVLSKGDKKVIIDYSHTADSLEKALLSIHHLNHEKRQIVTVFGCGGDRDATKRPVMGEIAGRLSNLAIVTSDNPRTENPFEIIEEIVNGMEGNNYKVVENRETAIKKAVEESNKDAVVLIAGKGHESYQEINGVRHHFSDKEIAEKYLKL